MPYSVRNAPRGFSPWTLSRFRPGMKNDSVATVGHTGTFALDASNALGDETTTHAGVILDEQVMSLIKESPRL